MNAYQSVTVLFLMIFTGFICKKKKLFTEKFQKDLSAFIINIALPLYVINNMQMKSSNDNIKSSFLFILIGFALYSVTCLLSILIVKFFNLPLEQKNTYQFSFIFPNASFMAFPIMEVLLGPDSIFYGAIFNINFHLFIWTFGVRIFRKDQKLRFRKMINPPSVAVLIGFILFITGIQLPVTISSYISKIGVLASPLAMILLGLLLGTVNLKELFTNKYIYLAAIYKLIILPFVIFGILFSLGFKGYFLYIPTIIFAMPSAINGVVITSYYEQDSNTMSKLVMATTLFSLITISLFTVLFDLFVQ